jgi:hypothetical protein
MGMTAGATGPAPSQSGLDARRFGCRENGFKRGGTDFLRGSRKSHGARFRAWIRVGRLSLKKRSAAAQAERGVEAKISISFSVGPRPLFALIAGGLLARQHQPLSAKRARRSFAQRSSSADPTPLCTRALQHIVFAARLPSRLAARDHTIFSCETIITQPTVHIAFLSAAGSRQGAERLRTTPFGTCVNKR